MELEAPTRGPALGLIVQCMSAKYTGPRAFTYRDARFLVSLTHEHGQGQDAP